MSFFKAPGVRSLALRGTKGTMLWSWHTPAVLRGWAIAQRTTDSWSLTAGVDRADDFLLRMGVADQRLRFVAARGDGGHWCWPVVAVTLDRDYLTAQLGQPE